MKAIDESNTNEQLTTLFLDMKNRYNCSPYPTYDERVRVLSRLKSSILKHEKAIHTALNLDFGYRSDFDTMTGDLLPCVTNINYTIKQLKKWMKPSKRHSGLLLMPSKVTVQYQPLGVVGVISPWNFPLYLALGPTIQALAAGNRVLIKMSEFTPHTNQVLRDIIKDLTNHIGIVEGKADIGAAFSSLPFDHLIFTGSSNVGKQVAQSAASNLTPVTLELGGKSPTIIDNEINIKTAVDAIIIGKSINSGQICVAPDYVFVPTERKDLFITTFIKRYSEYLLESNDNNQQTHIINEHQHKRILTILQDAKGKGAEIHSVKEINSEQNYLVYPQLITNTSDEMLVMKEEIFGSLLPVLTYDHIEDVIEYINDHERPLALYIMSKNRATIDRLLKNTHSGGVAINDTVMHVAADDAPFGGIGNSGMGHYHGHEGFLTFSKAKTVLHSSHWIPKNRFILKNRALILRLVRRILLK